MAKEANGDMTEICYWLATYFLLLGLRNCFFENQQLEDGKKIIKKLTSDKCREKNIYIYIYHS